MSYIYECLAEHRKSLGSFVRFSFSPLVQRLLLQPVIRRGDAAAKPHIGKALGVLEKSVKGLCQSRPTAGETRILSSSMAIPDPADLSRSRATPPSPD
jgi:hypothetical protein